MRHNTDLHWSKMYDQGRDFSLITSQEIDSFLSRVKPAAPKTCLDVGCGTGQLSRELFHRGYRIVGIDSSASAVQIASSLTNVPRQQLAYEHFDIEHDNLSKLPLQKYGLVTCKFVYAFIQDKPAFLQNVSKLLDEHGTFVIISSLQKNLPGERKCIGIDQKTTLNELQAIFERVDFDKPGQWAHFTCGNPL